MRARIRLAAGLAAGVLLTALGLAGCQQSVDDPASSTITVLAAASLQQSFDQIAADYQASHPTVDVVVSYGGSSALAKQVTNGSPADVFASASTKNMDTVVAAGKATDPTTFASNVLAIAVPPANPGGVSTLRDLARPGLKVALCQGEVPCGAASAKLLARQRITVRPVTQENDVKAVLTKVRLGEVDAGLVYATDVKAAGSQVKGITIPAAQNVSTSYPIAVLTDSTNPKQAQDFVDQVLSGKGRAVLQEAGFKLR